MSIKPADGVLIKVNGYDLRFHPQKFRDLAASKLKAAGTPQIEGSDLHQLQTDLEAADAGVEFTPDEVRQFAFNDDGGDIPPDAPLDHNGIAAAVIGKVKAENGAIQSAVANLDYAISLGLVKVVKSDDTPPPPNPSTVNIGEVKEPVVEPHDDAGHVAGNEGTDETDETQQALEAEQQQIDPNAPKGPGFWAKFGSWILGGLGILSAIGAFFAHAEGKARAFFAILGGLFLGGAVVNKWPGFGKVIFGGTKETPQQQGQQEVEPEAVTVP